MCLLRAIFETWRPAREHLVDFFLSFFLDVGVLDQVQKAETESVASRFRARYKHV